MVMAAETYVYDDQGDAARTCDGSTITWFTYAYDATNDATAAVAYYGQRYYKPSMARWLNWDPAGEQGGINLYGYVQNAPSYMWDAIGLFDLSSGLLDEMFKRLFEDVLREQPVELPPSRQVNVGGIAWVKTFDLKTAPAGECGAGNLHEVQRVFRRDPSREPHVYITVTGRYVDGFSSRQTSSYGVSFRYSGELYEHKAFEFVFVEERFVQCICSDDGSTYSWVPQTPWFALGETFKSREGVVQVLWLVYQGIVDEVPKGI